MKLTASTLIVSAILTSCSGPPVQTMTENPSTKAKVVADNLAFDDATCREKGLPVAITLQNTGTEASKAVRWYFSVNKINHSDDLTAMDRMMSTGDPNRRSDRIIQPGESYKVCSTLPSLPGNDVASPSLEYHIGVDTE